MAIPTYQELMLPLLRLSGDGKVHGLRDAIIWLANEFALSPEERRLRLPSGEKTVLGNRAGWARTHLKNAGLLAYPAQGQLVITDRGRKVLAKDPKKVDNQLLSQFPEYRAFMSRNSDVDPNAGTSEVTRSETQTPEEEMEAAFQSLREGLAADLLQAVKDGSPAFFESLVVDLLVKMGYGGTRKDAGEAIGGNDDEGIDGTIKEDRLGLDVIYLQAKRWEGAVGRPEVQKFAGALQGQKAKKGVFLTTSRFTQGAQDYVRHLDSKIILIDGRRLTELMIDFGVGVTTVQTYELKSVDSDYFAEG